MSVMLEGTFREAVPLHFLFKIESFSMLSKNLFVKYESNVFETGGYKWKLSIYPDGNKNETGIGHISLYLELVDNSLSDRWELNVLFRLFLFDRIRERYFFRGGNPFHEKKTVWGFPQFVSLAEFNDPANGYLVDDTCVFGAEVFVSKTLANAQCLSLVKQPVTVKHTWEIGYLSFSKKCYSEKFKAGDYNWNILLYPKGVESVDNYSLFYHSDYSVSLYLSLSDCEKDRRLKVCTSFKLRLRDQFNVKNIEFSVDKKMFSTSSEIFGWEKFIGVGEMRDRGNGYLVNDTCIVEAEVTVLGVVS